MNTQPYEVLTFLRESNNIEDVWDDLSLQQALLAWEYVSTEDKLTIPVILKTHKILMLHQPLLPNEKGYLRECPVYIGGREALHYSQIKPALEAWCIRVNTHTTIGTSSWKKDHVEYERIHPFVDGNGRTGRIFMNWQRIKAGSPLLIIEEKKKQDYYTWFQ